MIIRELKLVSHWVNMKTFVQFLNEAKKVLGNTVGQHSVVSLYHHPMHGTHHKIGYGVHHQIRQKLRLGTQNGHEPDEHEHAGYAHYKPKNNEVHIVHYGNPKPHHKKELEKTFKKNYSVPKGTGIKHYNINALKEV